MLVYLTYRYNIVEGKSELLIVYLLLSVVIVIIAVREYELYHRASKPSQYFLWTVIQTLTLLLPARSALQTSVYVFPIY